MTEPAVAGTLACFVQCVRDLRQKWEDDGTLKPHQELWFRGEAALYHHPLRPKIYRECSLSEDAAIDTVLDAESDLYEDFWRRGVTRFDVKASDYDMEWYWYYLMQHYGAPTRFLDWTDGALIGLHFALSSNAGQVANAQGEPVVWVLNSYALDKELDRDSGQLEAKRNWKRYLRKGRVQRRIPAQWERIYLPTLSAERGTDGLSLPTAPVMDDIDQITPRVASQRSRLMLFGGEADWLYGRYEDGASYLTRIEIEPAAVPRLRPELRDSGVTESVIFPDLDGLGREMCSIWEERRARLSA